MSYSPTDIHPPITGRSVEPYERREKEVFQLTPEEQRILKECSKEGVIVRAIPLGIIFGVGGFVGAKMGPLMTQRYGAKPAVIGLSFLGYMIGRFSYSKICFERALAVPDGNLKKLFPQMVQPNKEYFDSPDNYYAAVETPKGQDKNYPKQSSSMDLDSYTSINTFDTTPSEYYKGHDTEEPRESEPKVYTSYDDLRNQNRRDYSNKFYAPTTQQEKYVPPVRRPQEESPRDVHKQQTKYGDAWDA